MNIMLKELIADVSVLTFFLAFIIPFMILMQLFLPDIFPWKFVVYILPFFFGMSASYVINKGHDSEFLERTFITSLVVSVFLFIILYQSLLMINNLLSQFMKNIPEISSNQIPSFLQPLLKLNQSDAMFKSLTQSLVIIVGAMVDALIKTARKKSSVK